MPSIDSHVPSRLEFLDVHLVFLSEPRASPTGWLCTPTNSAQTTRAGRATVVGQRREAYKQRTSDKPGQPGRTEPNCAAWHNHAGMAQKREGEPAMPPPKRHNGSNDDAYVLSVGPGKYAHVLDTLTENTRTIVGPATKSLSSSERVVLEPTDMHFVPKGHFCVIEDPVNREGGAAIIRSDGTTTNARGDMRVIKGPSCFPLYPGEKIKQGPTAAYHVDKGDALEVKVIAPFDDDDGTARYVGEHYNIEGPIDYTPRPEVEVVHDSCVMTVPPGTVIKCCAVLPFFDKNAQRDRIEGEEWLVVADTGLYLPAARESAKIHRTIALQAGRCVVYVDDKKTGEDAYRAVVGPGVAYAHIGEKAAFSPPEQNTVTLGPLQYAAVTPLIDMTFRGERHKANEPFHVRGPGQFAPMPFFEHSVFDVSQQPEGLGTYVRSPTGEVRVSFESPFFPEVGETIAERPEEPWMRDSAVVKRPSSMYAVSVRVPENNLMLVLHRNGSEIVNGGRTYTMPYGSTPAQLPKQRPDMSSIFVSNRAFKVTMRFDASSRDADAGMVSLHVLLSWAVDFTDPEAVAIIFSGDDWPGLAANAIADEARSVIAKFPTETIASDPDLVKNEVIESDSTKTLAEKFHVKITGLTIDLGEILRLPRQKILELRQAQRHVELTKLTAEAAKARAEAAAEPQRLTMVAFAQMISALGPNASLLFSGTDHQRQVELLQAVSGGALMTGNIQDVLAKVMAVKATEQPPSA